MIPEINVETLAAKQTAGEDFFLLDVREPDEAEAAMIEGSTLIPMSQVPTRLAEIPRDKPVVVQCHHGGRSARVVQYLQSQGFNDVVNLAGGIDQWSIQINPEIPRY